MHIVKNQKTSKIKILISFPFPFPFLEMEMEMEMKLKFLIFENFYFFALAICFSTIFNHF